MKQPLTLQGSDMFETHESRNFPEDYEQENGNYINTCRDCKLAFRGNKHRIWCKMCETPNWEELAKIKRPDQDGPLPGAWLQGEMVGYSRCMVNKVKPLKSHVEALKEENERLRTTLVAGAELIKENWSKLCDEEGYGPQNLLLRMDGTLNTSGYPGYSSGEFARLVEIEDCNKRTILSNRQTISELQAEVEALRKEKSDL